MLNQSNEPQYLYLTTVGNKTGIPRQIEIWFVSFEGKYFVLAEDMAFAKWVKNIRANPCVRVRVGDQSFKATARILDKERDCEMYEKAQRAERAKYGWGSGTPVEIVPDKSE